MTKPKITMILDDIRQDILQLCTKEGKCEISDSEREQIAAFIYGIQISYPTFSIYDTAKGEVVYALKDQRRLVGIEGSERRGDDMAFIGDAIMPEELSQIHLCTHAIHQKWKEVMPIVPFTCFFNYNHRIKRGNKAFSVNQKLIPIATTSHHEPWLMLCIVSLSPYIGSYYLTFHDMQHERLEVYQFDKGIWKEKEPIRLTDLEYEIISLAMQGISYKEMGNMLYKSFHTIKKHSYTLFQKLGVNSMPQAITVAALFKL